MTPRRFARLASLAAVLAVPMITSAQQNKHDTNPATARSNERSNTAANVEHKLSPSELQVLAELHDTNQIEIQAGRLAESNGATAAVRGYGQMLVSDHGKNDRQLLGFLREHGQSLVDIKPTNEATNPDAHKAKDTIAKLGRLAGADFDREFLRIMIMDHDKAIAKVDADIATVTNPQLVSLLEQTKPVLVKHRDRARELSTRGPQA
jgi:putative membrane protein